MIGARPRKNNNFTNEEATKSNENVSFFSEFMK